MERLYSHKFCMLLEKMHHEKSFSQHLNIVLFSSALTLRHTIPYSEYESILKPDSVVNVAVVMQDMLTRERVLDAHEFSVSTAQITIQVTQHPTSSTFQLTKYHELMIFSSFCSLLFPL